MSTGDACALLAAVRAVAAVVHLSRLALRADCRAVPRMPALFVPERCGRDALARWGAARRARVSLRNAPSCAFAASFCCGPESTELLVSYWTLAETYPMRARVWPPRFWNNICPSTTSLTIDLSQWRYGARRLLDVDTCARPHLWLRSRAPVSRFGASAAIERPKKGRFQRAMCETADHRRRERRPLRPDSPVPRGAAPRSTAVGPSR